MYKALIAVAVAFVASQACAGAKPVCGTPPKPVADYLATHPGFKIADVPDLRVDDQGYWSEGHPGQCPGLVDFNADGSGRAAYGLLLVKKVQGKSFEQVVVLHYAKGAYQPHLVHPLEEVYTGVLTRAKPGKYEEFPPDDRPAKTVNLKYEGLEYVHLEASSTLIYFEGGKFKEIWTGD